MKVTTSLRAGEGEFAWLKRKQPAKKKISSDPIQVKKQHVSSDPIQVQKRHVQVGPKDRPSLRDLGLN